MPTQPILRWLVPSKRKPAEKERRGDARRSSLDLAASAGTGRRRASRLARRRHRRRRRLADSAHGALRQPSTRIASPGSGCRRGLRQGRALRHPRRWTSSRAHARPTTFCRRVGWGGVATRRGLRRGKRRRCTFRRFSDFRLIQRRRPPIRTLSGPRVDEFPTYRLSISTNIRRRIAPILVPSRAPPSYLWLAHFDARAPHPCAFLSPVAQLECEYRFECAASFGPSVAAPCSIV